METYIRHVNTRKAIGKHPNHNSLATGVDQCGTPQSKVQKVDTFRGGEQRIYESWIILSNKTGLNIHLIRSSESSYRVTTNNCKSWISKRLQYDCLVIQILQSATIFMQTTIVNDKLKQISDITENVVFAFLVNLDKDLNSFTLNIMGYKGKENY